METSLATSPLPSLSPLTGAVRNSIATEAIEKAFIDSQRRWLSTAGGSRHSTLEPPSPSGHGQTLPSPTRPATSGLREAASKHMAVMAKTPGTPYQRTLTPTAKEALRNEMAQKLQEFMAHLQASASAGSPQAGEGAEVGPSGAEGPSTAGPVGGRLTTPKLGERLGTPKRPSSSLPATELVMQRPASRLSRAPPPGPPAVSSSWSGPLSSLEQQQYQQHQQHQQHHKVSNFRPGSRLGLHSRLHTPMLVPAAARPPALHLGGGGRAEVWTNSTSVSAPPSPHSSGPRPGTSSPGSTSRIRSPGAAVGTSCMMGSGSFEKPKPSRGLMYSVFQDLDTFGEGRVTYSTFEDAALLCGIRTAQARKFFDMMDKGKQGFITTQEWGSREYEKQLSDFTRLYIQKTRGNDGRYKGAQEIDNLYAALQLAIYKLHLKNSGRSISHERLLQAFQFIDRDASGMLDRREVLDAFNGMGIYINDQVLDEAMRAFDKDGSGGIEYAEFITTLFPTLSKGYRMG